MRIRERLVVTAGLVCALGLAAVASAQNEATQFPVATRTLKNGMKVLVQSDHSIPNVALYIFTESVRAMSIPARPVFLTFSST